MLNKQKLNKLKCILFDTTSFTLLKISSHLKQKTTHVKLFVLGIICLFFADFYFGAFGITLNLKFPKALPGLVSVNTTNFTSGISLTLKHV